MHEGVPPHMSTHREALGVCRYASMGAAASDGVLRSCHKCSSLCSLVDVIKTRTGALHAATRRCVACYLLFFCRGPHRGLPWSGPSQRGGPCPGRGLPCVAAAGAPRRCTSTCGTWPTSPLSRPDRTPHLHATPSVVLWLHHTQR